MAPVMPVLGWRPVVRTRGKASSGNSAGSVTSAGTNRAAPAFAGKPSPKTMALPGSSGARAGIGYRVFALQPLPVIFAMDGITCAISAKTSRGWV